MTLWEYLKSKMQNNLGQVVCENHAEMTYEELIVFAEEYAKKLKGIKCCAILCNCEMAASVALLSCFAAGVTALPLSQRYGKLHCSKILETISPDAVIVDGNSLFQLIYLSDSKYVEPEVKPALIMCTSGTEGIPKGAMLTEKNIMTNIADISRYFHITSSDSILISRPLYHCAVLTGEFLTALLKGTKIRFYSGPFHPALMLKLLEQHEITVFCGTPTLIHMMARLKRAENKCCLKHICISGECMGTEIAMHIAKAFSSADIYHVYGLTEACPRVAFLPPKLFGKYPDCVGVPLKSVSLKVVRKDGTMAGIGEIGVLWVKGGNVMAGYYNNPQKTAETICDGWLCTGDLALMNEAGLLKIIGRNDDLIIKAGMNIYPQEVESAVKVDARVREVLVYGEKDETVGTLLAMDIAGDFSSVDEIRDLCRGCLPAYQMPVKINLVAELPKNGSGKIVRRKCK